MFPFDPTIYDLQDLATPSASSSSIIIPQSVDRFVRSWQGGVVDGGADPRQVGTAGDKKEDDEVVKVRKFVHREIERRRRQEMANLCGSLRTLLPLHYLKGKRSMSDNMEEAVNYIKDMETNIHRLKARKDKLSKKSSSANHCWGYGYEPRNHVAVNPCLNGVEIVINTSCGHDQGFPLSRILTEVSDRGFGHVVICVSTRVDSRLLHRIQLEARNDHMFEDLCGLQERLTYLINCPF